VENGQKMELRSGRRSTGVYENSCRCRYCEDVDSVGRGIPENTVRHSEVLVLEEAIFIVDLKMLNISSLYSGVLNHVKCTRKHLRSVEKAFVTRERTGRAPGEGLMTYDVWICNGQFAMYTLNDQADPFP